jgi:hypothetical protein
MATDAIEKYVEFHRRQPQKIGAFPSSFQIPARMYRAGASKWVTYESTKVDPETLVKPRKPVAYIHEHDAGVVTYLPQPTDEDAQGIAVPEVFREVPALARLGACLGFCVEASGEKLEAQATQPFPDLYTVASGKCLIVIQSRTTVLAMMWGGGLGVFARGIDG